MRSNVSRQTRRLFGAGHVQLLRARGPEQTGPLLPAYLDLEQRSWKYPAHAGILRSPNRTAFFSELVGGRAAYQPGMVGVVLDGVLIAGLLVGRFGSGSWALEMCFDEERRELGAGQVLLMMAMGEAIADGSTELGYLQHFAYFKKRWLAEDTAVVSTRVVRRGSPLHARRFLGEGGRWFANRVGPRRDDRTTTEALDESIVAGSTPAELRDPSTHDDARPRRLPDALDASRRLLQQGLRRGVLLDDRDVDELLPYPVR